MKTTAIICEFDPLHRGHEHLIKEARRAGAECVLCVMSGAFCQRGEPSSFPKHTRASAALAAGADIILELPFPYSCASAEYFAFGAIEVISAVGGVDTLAFGCESGDASELVLAAERTMSAEFTEEYNKLTAERPTFGAAALFEIAYANLYRDGSLFSGANNVLAIEYIKAARRHYLDIKFQAVKRVGSGHGELDESESFASASLIRQKLREGSAEIGFYLPDSVRDIILKEAKRTSLPTLANAERAILAHFRLNPEATQTADIVGGLGNRMADAASRAGSFEEFFELSRTKKYTDARIRRAVVFSMCGVCDADLHSPVSYTTLLGLNDRGAAFLSERKKKLNIPIVSNPAMYGKLPEAAQHQYTLSRRAEGLRSLCCDEITPLEDALRIPPVILKNVK